MIECVIERALGVPTKRFERPMVGYLTSAFPDLAKRRVWPHTIRHTTAMHLLQSGADISVIALWLGHESPATTHHYDEADLSMKSMPWPSYMNHPSVNVRPSRSPDALIDFLTSL